MLSTLPRLESLASFRLKSGWLSFNDISPLEAMLASFNLRELEFSLNPNCNYDQLFDFLVSVNHLEILRMNDFKTCQLPRLTEYLVSAPNMHFLRLECVREHGDRKATRSFIYTTLKKSMLSFFHISVYASMPFSTSQMYDIVSSKSYLTRVVLSDLDDDHNEHELNESSNPRLFGKLKCNKSIKFLSFYCSHDEDESSDSEEDFSWGCSLSQDEKEWKDLQIQASNYLRIARTLSLSSPRSGGRNIPNEIFEHILLFLGDSVWDHARLKTITRCLRDRRSLGMVHSPVTRFDKNVLAVRCTRVLDRMKAV